MDLVKTVIDEFNQKPVVDFYSKYDKFLPIEEYLCNKYFKEKGRVLVVGCGAGREAVALAKNGFKVVGIDIARNMIREAKNKAEEAGFPVALLQADVRQICFKENAFNFIIMFGCVIQHIPGGKMRIKVLRQLRQLLKPNGILLINFLKYSFFPCLALNLYLAWLDFLSIFLKEYTQAKPTLLNKMRTLKAQTLRRYYKFETASLRIWKAEDKRHCPGMEKGDLLWSGDNIPGKNGNKSFFHLYTFREMLADINNAGYKMLDCRHLESPGPEFKARRITKKGSWCVFFAIQ